MKKKYLARRSVRCCVALTTGAAILLLIGLTLPFVAVYPGANLDPLSGFAVWLLSDDDSYSLLQSVVKVWQLNAILGGLAFTFSLVTPFIKLSLLVVCAYQSTKRGQCSQRSHKWVERLGPWSMLEVFLLALLLLSTQGLPAGTRMVLLPGFFAFVASLGCSLLAAMLLPVGNEEVSGESDSGVSIDNAPYAAIMKPSFRRRLRGKGFIAIE